MPLPKSITETWDLTREDGTVFKLGPVRPAVAAAALDHINGGRYFQGVLALVEGGGLRGWTTQAGESVTRIGPDEIARLTTEERTAIGADVFKRTILTRAESD